jgi:ubiquinone/menaquinone biosynthesis C-methylase UbiE
VHDCRYRPRDRRAAGPHRLGRARRTGGRLGRLHQDAPERPHPRGASAVTADALALPLADGTVDAVILAYVLFHLADPARAAAEAARVLRPGGRAGIITWAWERQPHASTVWDQVLAEAGVPPARCAASIPG